MGLVEEDLVGVLLGADLWHELVTSYIFIIARGTWRLERHSMGAWLVLDSLLLLIKALLVLVERRLGADEVDLSLGW